MPSSRSPMPLADLSSSKADSNLDRKIDVTEPVYLRGGAGGPSDFQSLDFSDHQ